MNIIKRIKSFVLDDLWEIELSGLSYLKKWSYNIFKMGYMVIRGFITDKCQFTAFGLTYITLLAIIPFMAFIFSMSKAFGKFDAVKNLVLEKAAVTQEIIIKIIDLASRTNLKTLGIVGFGFLIWTLVIVLATIETSFNDIWGIKKSRNIFRKFTDYLSVILICPILALSTTAVNAFLSNSGLVNKILGIEFIGILVHQLLRMAPYLSMWLLFTFIYMFMPNVKVKFSSALTAGIIAGTLWQFTQWGYIHFQIGVSRYSAIYGTFASIPVFLIWLYISWLILLFGAEISFAHQNVRTYTREEKSLAISPKCKELLGLSIMISIARNFYEGNQPLTAAQLSKKLDISIRLVNQILFQLTKGGLVNEVNDRESSYQPSLSIEAITAGKVLDIFREYGNTIPKIERNNTTGHLKDILSDARKTETETLDKLTLKDIINRLPK
ncbi:YihY family inner membrane protein [bacterium]|nr:YihY family inner membrane protein [bacterium]